MCQFLNFVFFTFVLTFSSNLRGSEVTVHLCTVLVQSLNALFCFKRNQNKVLCMRLLRYSTNGTRTHDSVERQRASLYSTVSLYVLCRLAGNALLLLTKHLAAFLDPQLLCIHSRLLQMSSIITGPNHERRRDSSSAHEEFSPQPIRQQSGDDVSADELDPLSPNEPHITQPQSAGYTASSVKNLRHAQVQESPSDQEMDNISLQPLHPVSSNALGPENAIVSASTATSQTSPKSKSAWSFCLRFLRYGWTADGLGCAIAALSLIAICIILRVHANKPLPEWPYGITINALIAIFTITLKAGVALPLSESWLIGLLLFNCAYADTVSSH